jgi:DNA-binding HxlR family transcriptional regulator
MVTVEEQVGYITGNIKRKQIVDVIDKKGSESAEMLGKITRVPKLVLDRTLEDMVNKEIVKRSNDKYELTDQGKQAITVMRSIR